MASVKAVAGPCPFCYEISALVVVFSPNHKGGGVWFIRCEKCWGTGPIAYSEELARDLWKDGR